MAVAVVFGEYRVVDVLGHGAMGMVYRAHDPRLDRFVALKLVHPNRMAKDATKARARLVAEARALARVSHPNVLAVYDVGVQDDVVFVALELIEGVDLARWLRARRRRWTEIVSVFIEAASGLAAVHGAGLVHRDVKPANILVEHATRGRGFGRVLVADFGIARATETPMPAAPAAVPMASESTDPDQEASLTEEGRVVGTPAYMAPEQHFGLEVGAAADQYALCVALHEALYGKRPFGGDAQSMLRAKMNPPGRPPPSKVPAWLWTLVRRGLSPLAQDRFPTVSDLLAALRAGPPYRKWLVPAGVAVATLIAGGAIVSSLVRDPPCHGTEAKVTEVWNEGRRESIDAAFAASDRPGAVQTWARVSERFDTYARELVTMYRDACEAAYVRQEQTEALFDRRIACLENRTQELAQSLDLLAVGDSDLVDHADDVASSLGSIAACGDVAALQAGMPLPSPEEREAVADVRRVIADAEALQAAGRYDHAASKADAAVGLARTVDYKPAVVEALTLFGEIRERQSRIDEARLALDEAVSTALEIGDDVYVVRAAIMRTWIAAEYERDVVAAEKWGALGRSHLKRIGDPPRSAMALHNALGTAYSGAGRHEDALGEYEQALARVADDPELAEWAATLHANIGSVQYRLGDLTSASTSYQRALALFRERFGDDHPHVANIEVRLAQLLDLTGRHHEAIAGLRRAIAALELMQATPTELANALIALGLALRNAGADEESNTTYRRAVELLTPTGDDVSLAHALVSLGHSCVDQEIFDAAETQFQRAVQLLEPIDAGHPELGNAWLGLGRIRELQSKPAEALSLYRRAYDAAATDTRAAARAQVSIALLHHAAGRYDDAFAALDRQDAILSAAPLVLPDDRIHAAIVRVQVMVDAGRATEATAQIDALDRSLAEARSRGGSRRSGEGDLALGRARLARGEVDAARSALERAVGELDGKRDEELAVQARAALDSVSRR